MLQAVRRRVAALVAGGCLLAGCGAQPGTVEQPAGTTLDDARPVLPQSGPFRHTGRGDFRAATRAVTAERLGSSYRAGCPVPPSDLRLLQVTFLGFDGRPHLGEIVVHRSQAAHVVEVFRRLYDARFPVQQMVTVEQYGSDDDRSTAANNTSAFNCRTVTGGSGFSEHAYGTALDINPVQNPYVRGSTVLPEAGRAYLDRSDLRPGMVVAGDVVVRAFAAAGWGWGGDFRTFKDYQHFSLSGR
jgi:hypothetical protein